MALEDLSITFDDAKKVFGVCMAIGSFMAAGFVWISKIDSGYQGHNKLYEPIVINNSNIIIDEAKKTAVLQSEVINLKKRSNGQVVTSTGFVWDD